MPEKRPCAGCGHEATAHRRVRPPLGCIVNNCACAGYVEGRVQPPLEMSEGDFKSGRTPSPTDCAGCGHVAKHHTRRDSVYAGLMADYRVVWRCAWKGCGCPEYVKAPARVPPAQGGTGEHIVIHPDGHIEVRGQ